MLRYHLFLCLLSTPLVAATDQRKLFGVYVYAEQTLASSGYLNWDQLGCGVFTKPARTDGFIQFFLNPDNRIGQLKIDVVPLFKQWDTAIANYDIIIRNATANGIDVQFMESNSIPGDECADNCADTCKATGGGMFEMLFIPDLKTGVPRLATYTENQAMTKLSDEWQLTENAYEDYRTVGESILKKFGAVG